MPLFRFLVHGRDTQRPQGERGFYTTRHVRAENEADAIAKLRDRLLEEFSTGASARIWDSAPPLLEFEEGYRISWLEALRGPNGGSVFYDERE